MYRVFKGMRDYGKIQVSASSVRFTPCSQNRRDSRHLKTHSKPYQCRSCERGFALQTDLTRHVKARHLLGNARFACHIQSCTFAATRKDNLVQHKRIVHNWSPKSKPSDDKKEQRNVDLAENDPSPETPSPKSEFSRLAPGGRIWTCEMFLQAATTGSLSALKTCIASGFDVNIVADDKSSALHCATRSGNTTAVRYLLSIGADTSAKNEKGISPFQEAIKSGNLETVNLFCQSGAHLDSSMATVSSLAQSECKEILLQCLVCLGESIPHNMMYDILCIASRDGHVHTVIALLSLFEDSGRSLDTARNAPERAAWEIRSKRPDESGALKDMSKARFTPIHEASRKGHLNIVQLLVEHQVDLNLRCKGETPLISAARRRALNVVTFMMSLPGIDIKCLGPVNVSLLHCAAEHGWVEIATSLLDHAGIDVNSRLGYVRRTPLHLAAISGRLEVVLLLLQQENTDTRCRDSSRLTALQLATLYGHYQVARVLLNHEETTAVNDARISTLEQELVFPCEIMEKCLSHPDFLNINLRGNSWASRTPGLLHSAVRKRECGVIRILLRHKDIDVNLWDNSNTPLSLAAELGQTEAARLLLQHQNIYVNLEGGRGYTLLTPLQIARKKGASEIVELLLAKGARDDESSASLPAHNNATVSDSNIHESRVETLAENDLEVQSHPFLDEYMDDTFEDMEDEVEI
jgi:ankyrin repeat protein